MFEKVQKNVDSTDKKETAKTAKKDTKSSVVQLMPWHAFADFPRDKLNLPEDPAKFVPMTGYKFKGYSYIPKKVIERDTKLNAIKSAAEFIATLNIPSKNNLLPKKGIKAYRETDDVQTDFSQDKQAFSGHTDDYTPSFKLTDANYSLKLACNNIYDTLEREELSADINSIKDTIKRENNGDYNRLKESDRGKIDSAGSSADIKIVLKEIYEKIQREQIEAEKNGRTGNVGPYVTTKDPFQINVKTTYPSTGQTIKMNMHYQFTRESYGYVVRVDEDEDNGKIFYMANQSAISAPLTLTPEEKKEYYLYKHSKLKNTKIADVIDEKTDNTDDVRIDAITKIAGEGSRWQLIRDNAETITDKTIIYTQKHEDARIIYPRLTFKELWQSWSKFKNKYNIGNDEIKDYLNNLENGEFNDKPSTGIELT